MWAGWAVTPPGSMVTTTSGCSRSRNPWTAVVRASRSACSTSPSTNSPNSTRSTPTVAMAAPPAPDGGHGRPLLGLADLGQALAGGPRSLGDLAGLAAGGRPHRAPDPFGDPQGERAGERPG